MASEKPEMSVSGRILARLGELGSVRRKFDIFLPIATSIDDRLGGRQYKHSDVDTVLKSVWKDNPLMAADIKKATIEFRNKATPQEKLDFIAEQTAYVNGTYNAPEFAKAKGVYLTVLGWLDNEARGATGVNDSELSEGARGGRGPDRGRADGEKEPGPGGKKPQEYMPYTELTNFREMKETAERASGSILDHISKEGVLWNDLRGVIRTHLLAKAQGYLSVSNASNQAVVGLDIEIKSHERRAHLLRKLKELKEQGKADVSDFEAAYSALPDVALTEAVKKDKKLKEKALEKAKQDALELFDKSKSRVVSDIEAEAVKEESGDDVKKLRADKEKASQSAAEAQAKATPFLDALKSKKGKEEDLLEKRADLFSDEIDKDIYKGRVVGKTVSPQQAGSNELTIDYSVVEEEGEGEIKIYNVTFHNIDDAERELGIYINTSVRGYQDLRSVQYWKGHAIVEAMRVYVERAKPGIEKQKCIDKYREAVWEFETVKRLTDYFLIGCDAQRGMGKEFNDAVFYGTRITGEHIAWLMHSRRGVGVARGLSEPMPFFNISSIKAEFSRMEADPDSVIPGEFGKKLNDREKKAANLRQLYQIVTGAKDEDLDTVMNEMRGLKLGERGYLVGDDQMDRGKQKAHLKKFKDRFNAGKDIDHQFTDKEIEDLFLGYGTFGSPYGYEGDVNRILGVMLRLGSGMGAKDSQSSKPRPFKISRADPSKGVGEARYLEDSGRSGGIVRKNPEKEWEEEVYVEGAGDEATDQYARSVLFVSSGVSAAAMPGSPWLYEVMKNDIGNYLWAYPDTRHDYLALLLVPTGRYFVDDQGSARPVYRLITNSEDFYFITAFQSKGMESFWFNECFRKVNGQMEPGPMFSGYQDLVRLGWNEQNAWKDLERIKAEGHWKGGNIERMLELGWDFTKDFETNLRAMAMFDKGELLTQAKAGAMWGISSEIDSVLRNWSSVGDEESLRVLSNLPIDQLVRLPGAYSTIAKNLRFMKAWEIRNWDQFTFKNSLPKGNILGSWAMTQSYIKNSRDIIISLVRGELDPWKAIYTLQSTALNQFPEHLVHLRRELLNGLKSNFSRLTLVGLWRERSNGNWVADKVRENLAKGSLYIANRETIRIKGLGRAAAGYSYERMYEWPDWLLLRQAFQFIPEAEVWKAFCEEKGVSYEDLILYAGYRVARTVRATSFDGDEFEYNKMQELSEVEWSNWRGANQIIAGKIATMFAELPDASMWELTEPALEYRVESKIFQAYARAGGGVLWEGLVGQEVQRSLFPAGIPGVENSEAYTKMLRVLRRQPCGFDLRTEAERLPKLGNGKRPLSDEFEDRPWIAQRIGKRKVRLADGRMVDQRCDPHESSSTPFMYTGGGVGEVIPEELLDIDLMPTVEGTNYIDTESLAGFLLDGVIPGSAQTEINDILGRTRHNGEGLTADQQRRIANLRDYLKKTAEVKMLWADKREAPEWMVDELVEYAFISLTRDGGVRAERQMELVDTMARKKLGIDPIKTLSYGTMEACPLSTSEFSPQMPFYDTSFYVWNSVVRGSGEFLKQFCENEASAKNAAENTTYWTADKIADEYDLRKNIMTPLTVWLMLKGARNESIIDRNEFTALCESFGVNLEVAGEYYSRIANKGFKKYLTAKVVAEADPESGKGIASALGELDSLFGVKVTKLGPFSGPTYSVNRDVRNFGVAAISPLLIPGILNVFGVFVPEIQLFVLGVEGLSLRIAYAGHDRGDMVKGLNRIVGNFIGVYGDRKRITRLDSIVAGRTGDRFGLHRIFPQLRNWFGDIAAVPTTGFEVRSLVQNWAKMREWGMGQPTKK